MTTTDPKADADLLRRAEALIAQHPSGITTLTLAARLRCDTSHLYRLLCTATTIRALPRRGALTVWGPAQGHKESTHG